MQPAFFKPQTPNPPRARCVSAAARSARAVPVWFGDWSLGCEVCFCIMLHPSSRSCPAVRFGLGLELCVWDLGLEFGVVTALRGCRFIKKGWRADGSVYLA